MAAPRRLPVLQNVPAPPPGEGNMDRPAWHWVVIGAVLMLAIWAPLTMLAVWIVRERLGSLVDPQSPDATALWLASATFIERVRFWSVLVGIPVTSFVLASLAGGAMVGRFGAKAGPREALGAGVLTAFVAWALALARAEMVESLAILALLAAIGGGCGFLGAKLGRGGRARGGL